MRTIINRLENKPDGQRLVSIQTNYCFDFECRSFTVYRHLGDKVHKRVFAYADPAKVWDWLCKRWGTQLVDVENDPDLNEVWWMGYKSYPQWFKRSVKHSFHIRVLFEGGRWLNLEGYVPWQETEEAYENSVAYWLAGWCDTADEFREIVDIIFVKKGFYDA